MKRSTIVWPLVGAICGALGWVGFTVLLAASLGQEINNTGKIVLIALCPVEIIPRIDVWFALITNCLVYAAAFAGLRRIVKSLG